MQPVTVPVSSTVISPGVQVVSVQPRLRSVDERPTKILGIIQIIIGALCLIFGIALVSAVGSKHWVSTVGFGIWTGIWIAIGGIIGVLSAVHKNTKGLNAANMAFAIVSSCITFFEIIFYTIAVSYHKDNATCIYGTGSTYPCYQSSDYTGWGLSAVLLFLVIGEFIVSIAVSVYCCKSASCDCYAQSYEEQPVTVPVSSTVISPGEQVVSVQPRLRSVDERPTKILGIIQIIFGVLFLIFGTILVSFGHLWVRTSLPLVIGVWASIGGILGVFSAVHKTNQHLNVANTCFAIVSFIIIISSLSWFGVFPSGDYGCRSSGWDTASYCYKKRVRYVAGVVLQILFITEFIVSIAAVVYGFKNICGCCPPKSNEETQLLQRPGIQSATQVTPISTQYDQPQSTDQDPPPAYIQTAPQITMMTTQAPI